MCKRRVFSPEAAAAVHGNKKVKKGTIHSPQQCQVVINSLPHNDVILSSFLSLFVPCRNQHHRLLGIRTEMLLKRGHTRQCLEISGAAASMHGKRVEGR
jgi:hypothetical protein